MKVKELIEELQKLDPELKVEIADGQGETITGEDPIVKEVFLVENEWIFFDTETFKDVKYMFEDEKDPKKAYEKCKKENRVACFLLEGMFQGR